MALTLLFCSFFGVAWEKRIPAQQAVPNLEETLQLLAEGFMPFDDHALLALQHQVSRDAVRVVVEAERLLPEEVGRLGGSIVHTAPELGLWEVHIPISEIVNLSSLPGVRYVRPPFVAVLEGVTSAGVGLLGAGEWHAAGLAGQGVRVAVIDLEFGGLQQALASGELRRVVYTKDYTGSGLETGGPHGVACAEIVQDMAPEAELLLLKIDTEVQLAQAVRDAVRMGARIITHSVAWFNTNFYDGTGVICEIVRYTAEQGVLWVNAAGNYAAGAHWEGAWQDNDGDGLLDFAFGVEVNTFSVQAGETVLLCLTWDGWPVTDQDYDLYLVDAQTGLILASSTNTQNGRQPPTEAVVFRAPFTGTYGIAIHRFDAPLAPRLELFCSSSVNLRCAVAESSLPSPADAPWTLTVGAIAVSHWSSGPQEPFSSQGPTNVSRLNPTAYTKPDIMAPDRVETGCLGSSLFVGTSAAAPHIAGAAALIFSAYPSWNSSQVKSWLEGIAIDLGFPGKDNVYGSGRLSLPLPPNLPSPPSPNSVVFPPGKSWISLPVEGLRAGAIPTPLYEWTGRRWQALSPDDLLFPERGYLVNLRHATLVEVSGDQINTDRILSICKGYNFISAPWKYRVANIQVMRGTETKSWDEAVRAGWVYRTVTAYQAGRYKAASVIDPWYGYRVRARVDGLTLKLVYSLRETSATTTALEPLAEELEPGWDEPMPEPEGVGVADLQFLNTPNPIRDVHTTTFKVVGPLASWVTEIKVQVFDLSGRLVWEGNAPGAELVWHTEDFLGRYLANGVYLYRIMVKVGDTWVSSELKKLAIYR